MERSVFRPGIRVRFALTVATILGLACLILILFFIHREKGMAEEVLTRQGKALARSLAGEIESLGPGSTPDRLPTLIRQFAEREDVSYGAVEDGRGRILAETRSKGDQLKPDQIVTFSHPILGSKTEDGAKHPIGTVRIGLSRLKWTERLPSSKRTATLLALLLVAFGLLVTLGLVHYTTKPLRMLMDATQRMARGDLDTPIRVTSSDEIGKLSQDLHEMALRVQESRANLEEYSRSLEKKMADRTEELEKRVKELSDSRMATLNILEDVKEAKTELERVNKELLALDEMKSRFIGTISHELKTPFTAIKANIDFILSGREGEVPPNLNQYLLTVQRNTNRVRKIMEDFLNVAEIHSTRRRLEPEEFQLGAAVREYLSEMGPIDGRFHITVDISDDISVFADRNRLHDVYVNLVLNALKFSPDGGEIRITARPHDGQVLSEVSDEGTGIPLDKLNRIFEAFFQVDRKKYGGTGLGLSIVKGIIEEHGGKIWVDSRPGEGSTFFFTLPTSRSGTDEPI